MATKSAPAPEKNASAVATTPKNNVPALAGDNKKLTRAEIIALAGQSPDIFENTKVGEMVGGSYTRLELKEGEISRPFVYLKDSDVPIEKEIEETDAKGIKTKRMITERKAMQVLQIADESESTLYSTPISSIFQKHWKDACVGEGDVILIKRYPDAIKKRGLGMGNRMQVYAIKVLDRATPSPATA